MTGKDFIPDSEFDSGPSYPTVFGITLTPPVTGALIALIGIAGAAYLAVNVVLPTWDQNQQLSTTVQAKQNEVQQQEANLKKIAQVKADLEATKQRREDVLALFANEKTLNTSLLDLNQLIDRRNSGLTAATRSKLNNCPAWVKAQYTDLATYQDFESKVGPLVARAELQKFAPDDKSSGIISDNSFGAPINNKLKRQVVSVQFKGNFNQTLSILRSIERLQNLLLISDFKSAIGNQSGGTGQVAGLYEFTPTGAVRFLTNCQPEPTIVTSFKLQALVPLTAEEAATVPKAPAK